jgi:hypothetical protein
VSEKKSLRPETLIAKTIAQKGSQPAPKNQKKLEPSSASPAQKATEQDDDWQEF